MCDELIAKGKRNLVCGEICEALENFEKLCKQLSEEHGDLDERLAEPNLLYGTALLELARMESTVLGNALDGVPEGDSDSSSDEIVESGPDMTGEEKDDLSNQILDAMCENAETTVSDKKEDEVEVDKNSDVDQPKASESGTEEEGKILEVENAEDENASSSEEEDAVEPEGDEQADPTDDVEEPVSNLQLAWEVIEVAKKIFSQKDDADSKLKVSECLAKLGEISREKEDYPQSVSDLQACLALRTDLLPEDSRQTAEVHYQLGITHAVSGDFDAASKAFGASIKCLKLHVANLKSNITELENLKGDEKQMEALRHSMKEVDDLIPEVERRLAEVDDDRSAAIAHAGLTSTSSDIQIGSFTDKPADDITHLVRKKREVASEGDSSDKKESTIDESPKNKKIKLSNGNAPHTNGSAPIENATNGTNTPQIFKMECQFEKNVHFRHLFLFAFNQGFNAAKAVRDICAVYGENATSVRTARDWYSKFRKGNFDLKDAPRSGRPTELNKDRLNQLLHENSRQTTRELAEKMQCSHTAIENYLHSLGKAQIK